MHTCPRCQKSTIYRGQARDITLGACGLCHGIWLDASAAARVYAAIGDTPPEPNPARTGGLACVVCGQAMQVHTPSGTRVEIDSCRGHGVWFDRSELAVLVGLAAQRHGVRPPKLALDAGVGDGADPVAVTAGANAAGAVRAVLTADMVSRRAVGEGAVDDELLTQWAALELALHGPGLAIDMAQGAGEVAHAAIETGGALASGVAEAVTDAGALETVGELSSGAAETAASLLEGILELLGGLFS